MHRGLVGVLIGLAALGGLGAALAAGPDVAALRGELEARSLARDDARAQAQQLREDITRLDAQLAELRAVAATGTQGLAEKRSRLGDLNQREAALRADMGANQSALADGRAEIEQSIREKTALQHSLETDAADAERRAQTLSDALRSAGVSPQAVARAEAGPTGPPVRMLAPAPGLLIRRFGQSSPGGQTSDGLTWRTGSGAQVRAPAGGVVEYSGPLKGWGGVLILNVGGGYDLVLAGLDRITATTGRPVRAGQTLGAMAPGAGPELYLELRSQRTTPVDPARWFSPEALAANGRG